MQSRSYFHFILGISLVWLQVLMPVQAKDKTTPTQQAASNPAFQHGWATVPQNPENPANLAFNSKFPDKAWWQQFNDPNLNRYIEMALASNPQLAIARARINEERATARYSLAQEFPLLNFAGSVIRVRNSSTQFSTPSTSSSSTTGGVSNTNLQNPAAPSTSSSSASTSGLGAGSTGTFVLGKPFTFYSLPLQASYEPDIFLLRRDQTRAANKQTQATTRDYQTALISLVTDVSGAYFNLVAQDKIIAFQKDYIRFSQNDVAATQAQQAAGLVYQENVVIKEGILANAQAVLQENYRLQTVYANQLATLLGKTPEEIKSLPRGDLDQFAIPDVLSVGLPSQLIARRPDILSAEDLLERSKINVRVARKAFLPSFTLTGQFGVASGQLSKLLEWNSRTILLGASGLQSIFNGGALRANVRIYKAREQEQLYQYRQTILTAFQEVDNAIGSVKTHKNAYENYIAAYNLLNQQLGFQQTQLNQGAIAGSELYATQIQVAQAQEGLVNAKALGLIDIINLYKALGGGF